VTDWEPRGHPDWQAGRWPSATTVGRQFGTWGAAIEAAGVQPHPGHLRSWADEEIVQAIKDWADEHDGDGPLAFDWCPGRNHPDPRPWRWPTADVVERRFGSWEAALAAAGVTSRARRRRFGRWAWSPDDLLERIQTWAVEHGGHAPLSSDWRPGGHPDYQSGEWPSAGPVFRAFGTWRAALAAAEVAPHPDALITWDSDGIIRRIKDWAADHGGNGPTPADWTTGTGNPHRTRGEWPSRATVIAHFDSWDAALDAAGVAPARHGSEVWTSGVIVARLQAWAAAHGGFAPRSIDWRPDGAPDWAPGQDPTVDTVLVRFGSWQAALSAAGLTARPSRSPASPRSRRRWSAEAIAERIRAWTAGHDGTPPRPTDWRRGGHPDWLSGEWPSGNTVKARYGSWDAALAAASSPPAPPRS
jgi:hypothetical protein